jgi:hypothetical protein
MRIRLSLVTIVCFLVSCARIDAQQVTQMLHSSLTAQGGQSTIQDVTLNGTVQSVSGADSETATGIFKAISTGSARSDVSLSEGTLTEIRQVAAAGPSGAWSRGSSVNHAMSGHNMMTDAAWFFPLFIVQRLLSDQNVSVVNVGVEGTMTHLRAVENPRANLPASAAQQIQHLTQIDLYLDTATLLPVGLWLNIHPDNNALTDIPVYIAFSNYQQKDGVTIPMRVQKYVNNTLQMDIQVQSATFNTGLSQSDFAIQ